jgi:hypothetical protein
MAVAAVGQPPVAPLDDAPRAPSDLRELYRKAKAGTYTQLDWVFFEARARGRLAVADRQHRRLEEEDRDVRFQAGRFDTDVARAQVMQNAPDHIRWHKAEQAVADATAEVSVCGRMIEMLSKKGAP